MPTRAEPPRPAAPGDAPPCERPATGAPYVNVQESAARYAFAAAGVGARRVLDVATGAGFGAELLRAYGARFVVGADAAADALAPAPRAAVPAGLHFVRADAGAMPFGEASFDVIVSFETIEHVDDARRMLAECRRALRPGGLLYLSTPNRSVTRWLPPNPFHLREFTAAEITALVREHFGSVACHWQRPVFVPAFALRQLARRCLAALPAGRGVWRTWERIRPARTRLGAAPWYGRHFDASLLEDLAYRVTSARRRPWTQPTYTVLVAR